MTECIKACYSAKNTIVSHFHEPIPIAQGYIRLAIVKEHEQRQKERSAFEDATEKQAKGKGFTTLFQDKRLGSFEVIYGTKTPIGVNAIFKPDTEGPKKGAPIYRVLILGRAGIGKSTLCQHIAYEWAQGRLWKDRFKLLVVVHLRKLLSKAYIQYSTLTLEEVIYQECIPDNKLTHHKLIAKEIVHQALTALGEDDILYVLDGYDEVSHYACETEGQETPPGQLIRELLSQKNAIITSRPYRIEEYLSSTWNTKPIDRTLENIGFLEDDIEKYIDVFFARFPS